MYLNSFDFEFQIAAFTETWLTPNTFNSEIMCDNFQIFRRDRLGKLGGGVLIAVSCIFPAEEIKLENISDIEIIIVVIKIGFKSLYISCSYIPPNSGPNVYNEHLLAIKSAMENIKTTDVFISLGDFNLPSVSWFSLPETDFLTPICPNDWSSDFFQSFFEINLYQLNHIQNINNRTLDLVFVNNPFLFDITKTGPLSFPEDRHHPTIGIMTSFYKVDKASKSTSTYCYKKTDFDKLNELLSNVNWYEVLSFNNDGSNFDNILQRFYSIISSFISETVPMSKNKTNCGPPWNSATLRWLKNRKNRLFKQFKITQNPTYHCHYLIARNKFNMENKRCYNSYLFKVKSNIRRNPKLFYNFVNSKRKVTTYPTTMKMNGILYSNDADISNVFAGFFASTYSSKTINEMIIPNHIQEVFPINIPFLDSSLVLKNLKSIKICTNPGPDGIPSIILRNCAEMLSYPLTYLFNSSLKYGYFPLLWKLSFIVPIHKSGGRSEVTNYRGIAKLNAIPKLFEKMVTDMLSRNLLSIISPYQHGFCKGRSTCTNLMELSSYINAGFCNGNPTDVVYTDFSKAFDKVNHELLIIKLKAIGFNEILLKWIYSYLKQRKQCVLYNNCKSEYINAISGVPQGSHLGPILFLLFINDLPLNIHHCKILMYADDVKIFKTITNPNDQKLFQNDLNCFFKWCDENLMELNLKKCKHMVYYRRTPNVFAYNLGGVELSTVNSFTDLGVLFDMKLTFNSHIQITANKASGVLCFVKRWAKEFKDPYVTKRLYTSLVRPILEYASVIWDPYYNIYINKLESVQKQFLLFCLRGLNWNPNIRLPPYRSRLALIRLPTLKSRRTVSNISFIIDLLQGKIDSEFLLGKISISVPNRMLRSYHPLTIPFHRSNFANLDPFYKICSEVNSLYNYVDFSDSPYNIKMKLLSFLNSNNF